MFQVSAYAKKIRSTSATAIVSGPLLALSQSIDSGGFIALFALTPWLLGARKAGLIRSIGVGATVGTIYGCIWAAWIPEVLQELGASRVSSWIGLLLAAVWTKVPLFIFVSLAIYAAREWPPIARIAITAAAFGFGEWALGYTSTSIPVAMLGHSQAGSLGISQLAAVGGIPLLTGWIAATNQAIAISLEGSAIAKRTAIALLMAWIATVGFGLPLAKAVKPYERPQPPLSLMLVQPDLPRGERWVEGMQLHNLEVLARYTDGAITDSTSPIDAVVWPENLLTSRYDANRELSSVTRRWIDKWDTPLITGMVRSPVGSAPDLYKSSVLWIESNSGIRDSIDKERAIPVIESSREILPNATAEALFGRAALWPKVEEVRDAGPLVGSFEVAPALCFEVLFPSLVERRRTDQTAMIVNLSDESWLSGKLLSRELLEVARFRAIEQRLPLVRVAHGGVSAVVDPFGELTLELPTDKYAHAVVSIPRSSPPTLTEKLAIAALPTLTAAVVYGLLSFAERRRRLNQS